MCERDAQSWAGGSNGLGQQLEINMEANQGNKKGKQDKKKKIVCWLGREVAAMKLRLKSNHLQLRPKGEHGNHRELRAQEPNIEEIMLLERRNPSVSKPRQQQ